MESPVSPGAPSESNVLPSQAPDSDAADRHVESTPYDTGKADLGRGLLRVESAAATVNYSLLVYGFVLAGLMFLLAAVYTFVPHQNRAAYFALGPCLAIGVGLLLACSNTLIRRLDLHEHGVCVRGLFRARKLRYRDLADVEITPFVITRTVNFVPVSRQCVLRLQFVPGDGTGLKPIEYVARFDQLDQVARLVRQRAGYALAPGVMRDHPLTLSGRAGKAGAHNRQGK
jgi:hypothetical protein